MDAQYDLIAEAIAYLSSRAQQQPTLEELSRHTGLSPFHMQRTFRKYVGVTPKQFLAALTLEHAKASLAANASVLEATLDAGLSSPARLHDHFVALEAMTPGEFKRGGAGMTIAYATGQTPFGRAVAARTDRGIAMLEFVDESAADELVRLRFPNATLVRDDDGALEALHHAFDGSERPLRLHVRGTNFQVRVWQALLNATARGEVTSYARIAAELGAPTAARAVGNAVGSNPVAVLIPCHRVLAQTGVVGNYRWGSDRKRALLAWERARVAEA